MERSEVTAAGNPEMDLRKMTESGIRKQLDKGRFSDLNLIPRYTHMHMQILWVLCSASEHSWSWGGV